MLQQERLSIASCLTALREVYRQPINDSLVLRALTYFDDAEKQAPLPGEGPKDWQTVREFFMSKVGEILQPPRQALAIQSQIVDVLVR